MTWTIKWWSCTARILVVRLCLVRGVIWRWQVLVEGGLSYGVHNTVQLTILMPIAAFVLLNLAIVVNEGYKRCQGLLVSTTRRK